MSFQTRICRALGRRTFVLLLAVLLLAPATLTAQLPVDTVAMRRGSVGAHGLVGVVAGRLQLDGGARLDVLGMRAGVGLGELVQLTGFYWRGVDSSERTLLGDQAVGGEAQLNLQSGFGLTPFIAVGAARLGLNGQENQTAATGGAGFMLPLGPVLLRAAVHDYLLGVSGLPGAQTSTEPTHNWLFTVGATAGLGRGRAREAITVARPEAIVATPDARPDDRVVRGVADTAAGVLRNYHSDRRIEIPLPTEGSIVIRYGPEPAAVGAPRADPSVAVAPTAPLAIAPPVAGPISSQEMERLVQRSAEAAVARLVPRLEAAEAQRMNVLRAELRQALAEQRDQLRDEVVRLERRLGRDDTTAVAVGPPAAQDFIPPPVHAPARADPEVAPVRPAHVDPPTDATGRDGALRAEAETRMAFAVLATRHGPFLRTAETERGPAIVVAGVAFRDGTAFVEEAARDAIRDAATLLRERGDRLVFVQAHTDATRNELQDQRLSELRAETIRALLSQAGVDPVRMRALGYGRGRPVANNDSPAGRALNRRVEIVLDLTDTPEEIR